MYGVTVLRCGAFPPRRVMASAPLRILRSRLCLNSWDHLNIIPWPTAVRVCCILAVSLSPWTVQLSLVSVLLIYSNCRWPGSLVNGWCFDGAAHGASAAFCHLQTDPRAGKQLSVVSIAYLTGTLLLCVLNVRTDLAPLLPLQTSHCFLTAHADLSTMNNALGLITA